MLLLATVNSYGQKVSMQKIEKDLVTAYKKITDERDSEARDYDSLTKYNYDFAQKLSKYISEVSPSLNYEFDSLQRVGVGVVMSDDGLFRIYSWDTRMGGGLRDYNNAYQYKKKGKVYGEVIRNDGDRNYGSWYSQVFTLNAGSRTYYIAIYNFFYTGKNVVQGVDVFSIENTKLSQPKIFRTNSGLGNSIHINYDFFSVKDRPERPLTLIKYNSKTKTLYIPIVLEDGQVTRKFITYCFNGKYFERVKR